MVFFIFNIAPCVCHKRFHLALKTIKTINTIFEKAPLYICAIACYYFFVVVTVMVNKSTKSHFYRGDSILEQQKSRKIMVRAFCSHREIVAKKVKANLFVGESETTIHNKITVNVISFIIIYDRHCFRFVYARYYQGVINNVQL